MQLIYVHMIQFSCCGLYSGAPYSAENTVHYVVLVVEATDAASLHIHTHKDDRPNTRRRALNALINAIVKLV